jgi:hypothetical protein
MHYELSSGKRVEVFFNHQYDIDDNGDPFPYGTHCTAIVEGNEGTQHFEIETHCHPNDQFTKLGGRLHSYQKLFGKSVMTKEERKKKGLTTDEAYYTGVAFDYLTSAERDELFNLVFPKFRNTPYQDVIPTEVKQTIDKEFKDNPKLLQKVTSFFASFLRNKG